MGIRCTHGLPAHNVSPTRRHSGSFNCCRVRAGLFFCAGRCPGVGQSHGSTITTPYGSVALVRKTRPSQSSVAAGATVRWVWDGGTNPHDVVWIDGAGAVASQIQITGEYTRDFFLPGTYEYYCSVHGTPTSGMRGTVTVN